MVIYLKLYHHGKKRFYIIPRNQQLFGDTL